MVSIYGGFSQFNLNNTIYNNGPFDPKTNEGWGANAYLNSRTGASFSYTKETTTGNLINGDNNKKFSLDSAFAFSEMALKATDGKAGNSDGKVSVEEFNKGSGANLGSILDVDGDGFISRSELTSYYLLVDRIDGNLDGNINPNASSIFSIAATLAPDAIKNMLKGNNDAIKEADSKFQMTLPTVDGSKGSYNNNDKLGKFANLGQEAAKLASSKKLIFSNFEYADKTDLSTGLASMTELQKSQDRNGDGKVSIAENRASGGTAVDIDGDGFISAGEFLAETMSWDKNGDGKITYEERLYGQKLSQETGYADKVKQIYSDNKISALEKTFQMPQKTTQTDSNSDFVQRLYDLIMQLLGLNIAK